MKGRLGAARIWFQVALTGGFLGLLAWRVDIGDALATLPDANWLWVPLALVAFVATLGISAIGTLFAAMTAQAKSRDILLPVLMFPLLAPVLIGAVKATAATSTGILGSRAPIASPAPAASSSPSLPPLIALPLMRCVSCSVVRGG